MRVCSAPAASRAEVRAKFMVASSAAPLLLTPMTDAVMAKLNTTKTVAAKQILAFKDRPRFAPGVLWSTVDNVDAI
jgi:hypothetical protein